MADPYIISITGRPEEDLKDEIQEAIDANIGDFTSPVVDVSVSTTGFGTSLSTTYTLVIQESYNSGGGGSASTIYNSDGSINENRAVTFDYNNGALEYTWQDALDPENTYALYGAGPQSSEYSTSIALSPLSTLSRFYGTSDDLYVGDQFINQASLINVDEFLPVGSTGSGIDFADSGSGQNLRFGSFTVTYSDIVTGLGVAEHHIYTGESGELQGKAYYNGLEIATVDQLGGSGDKYDVSIIEFNDPTPVSKVLEVGTKYLMLAGQGDGTIGNILVDMSLATGASGAPLVNGDTIVIASSWQSFIQANIEIRNVEGLPFTNGVVDMSLPIGHEITLVYLDNGLTFAGWQLVSWKKDVTPVTLNDPTSGSPENGLYDLSAFNGNLAGRLATFALPYSTSLLVDPESLPLGETAKFFLEAEGQEITVNPPPFSGLNVVSTGQNFCRTQNSIISLQRISESTYVVKGTEPLGVCRFPENYLNGDPVDEDLLCSVTNPAVASFTLNDCSSHITKITSDALSNFSLEITNLATSTGDLYITIYSRPVGSTSDPNTPIQNLKLLDGQTYTLPTAVVNTEYFVSTRADNDSIDVNVEITGTCS